MTTTTTTTTTSLDLAASAATFTHRVTPRFFEIDSEGVMFNMWYLGHADEAVTAFFEHRGRPRARWRPDLDVDVRVAHVEMDWAGPVVRGDVVDIEVAPARVGTKSFTLDVAFRTGGAATCTVAIVYVVVAADGSGSAVIPEPLRRALTRM